MDNIQNTSDIKQEQQEAALNSKTGATQTQMPQNHRKCTMLTRLLISCLCLLILLCFVVHINQIKLITFQNKHQIVFHTNYDFLSSLYDNIKVIFQEGDKTFEYTYKELGIKVKWSEEQKEQLDRLYINLDEMDICFECSDELITTLQLLNENRQDWASATFVETESAFVVTEEIEGNKVNIQNLAECVQTNCSEDGMIVDLNDFKYPQPDDWITYKEYDGEFVKWNLFFIEYSNGFKIDKEDIKQYFYLSEDCEIIFDETKREQLQKQVWSWIENDLDSYNTLGGTFKFTTHAGNEIELPGVNYGDKMDKQAECEFLMGTIENLWPCPSREPAMEIDVSDDIQSNIIEISIQDQHLWVWRNRKVDSETNIVTGLKDVHDTPIGVYQVLNMIDGVYLEGVDYKVWVDKWMRFWNGYGLHDAMWRNKFGEQIYKYNGSHGCINLPHDFAVQLYDKVKPGDVIVIY